MCATCGCSGSDHSHDHEPRLVPLEAAVLAKNDHLAGHNREWLHTNRVFAVNLMSSPGAGKTTLLERTVSALTGRLDVFVVEGDQETRLDAGRVERAGATVVQVNTGSGCHLDAEMVAGALESLAPPAGSVLFIENVGNLVCPALFDLGEEQRVVLTSVTEGADKPLKYPQMFASASLVVLNKIDLLPYVDSDPDAFQQALGRVSPGSRTLHLAATRGDGLTAWLEWLLRGVEDATARASAVPTPVQAGAAP